VPLLVSVMTSLRCPRSLAQVSRCTARACATMDIKELKALFLRYWSAKDTSDWATVLQGDQFVWQYGTTPLSHIQYPLFAIAGYLVVVFVLRAWMSTRTKFELKAVVRYHNAVLCVWSFLMLVGCLHPVSKVIMQDGLLGSLCDARGLLLPAKGLFAYTAWHYYASKYYELADTVIIVLKKNPLTVLQMWHHVSVLMLTWLWQNSGWSLCWWGIACNTTVHVFMYYYFSVATLGKRPWWKKYLTMGQLVQFATVFINIFLWLYLTRAQGKSCAGDEFTALVSQGVNISYLCLFGAFYARTYKSTKRKEQ